jgi:predicted Zn finger-like uncharacterized protein
MSLITRCPACGTMFNVVTDQLKISQGWVRCGQCAVVFDAALHLQTERAPPADLPVSEAVSDALPVPSAPTSSPGFAFSPDTNLPSVDSKLPEAQDSFYAEEMSVAPKEADNALDSELPSERLMPSAQASDEPVAPEPQASFDPQHAVADEAPPDVSFVRDARRKIFWRKPVVRVLLALVALLLVALLVLQLAVQQRNELAVFQPRLKPALQTVCEVMGCIVGPVRQIETIVIDSSSFNKVNDSVYRLSFSIKSTASTPVAMPALEVTLTDAQDQVLIRRVLTPAQFGVASGLLGTRAEFFGAVTLQLTPVEAGSASVKRIASYRLLAFYP